MIVCVFLNMGQSDDTIASAPVKEKGVDEGAIPCDVSGHSSGDDAEKQSPAEAPELKRKLKSRHLQMIAIGQ